MFINSSEIEKIDFISTKKYGIAVSEFNKLYTEQMYNNAINIFKENKIEIKKTIWVSGAFELPLASKILIENYKIDAVLTLGVVIRGETSHYDHICNTVATNLAGLSLQFKIPVIFGVLTCENIQQVEVRLSNVPQLVISTIKMAHIN